VPFWRGGNRATIPVHDDLNVFGKITADNLGYASVELAETIAAGHTRCKVVVHLDFVENLTDIEFREYFAVDEHD